ncbi:MAG: copper amine oxidase N-terminal domain-containing protein [Defluviitaleaceae bacterium]|nr:copper amine oxidase N-terminal domain-containing protein [Defluviitaleaceae bacterium]
MNETANQLDAAPFIDETTDRTMLPLRAVATALGAEVAWEGSTRTVTITQAHTTLTLTADIPLPDNMGAPLIVNDRVFVPARYVAEMLGANVLWDAMNRAVYITV